MGQSPSLDWIRTRHEPALWLQRSMMGIGPYDLLATELNVVHPAPVSIEAGSPLA
jgi:hypothetical protein